MQADPNRSMETGSQWRSKRRLWILLGIVFVAALVFAGYRLRLSWKIDQEVTAIREGGHPVTLRELQEAYSHPPDHLNGALILSKAFDSKVSVARKTRELVPVVGYGDWPSPGKPLPPKAKAAIRDHLQANSEAIELLRKGAAADSYRYPIDLTQGSNTRLPHLAPLKSSVRLLCLHARYSAAIGEREEAVRSIEAAWTVANSLEKEPLLISHLVRNAGQATTYKSVEELLNQASWTAAQLARLSETLESPPVSSGLKNSLIGERCMRIAVFQSGWRALQSETSEDRHPLAQFRMAVRQFTGAHSRDHLFYLTMAERMVDLFETPFPERIKEARQVANRVGNRHSSQAVPEWLVQFLEATGFSPDETPEDRYAPLEGLPKTFARQARIMARGRLTQAALGVERFRSKDQDRPPESLDRLVPDYLQSVPTDPFTGKPVQYRVEDQGYRLYSFGPDRHDNQGEAMSGESGDIVVRIRDRPSSPTD